MSPYTRCTALHTQEGKELQAKTKADTAVKNEGIKAQLARQLQDRKQQEQAEKQEEIEYAQLEQVCAFLWVCGMVVVVGSSQFFLVQAEAQVWSR